jgi:hypothetical protein
MSQIASFDYVNYRGEKSHRKVTPLGLRFGTSKYHKESTFLLRALDLDKGEEREFAIRDMSNVSPGVFLMASSSEEPTTTEQLDQLQFGRTLHERPDK